jgi:hypothetical protein
LLHSWSSGNIGDEREEERGIKEGSQRVCKEEERGV